MVGYPYGDDTSLESSETNYAISLTVVGLSIRGADGDARNVSLVTLDTGHSYSYIHSVEQRFCGVMPVHV